MSRTAQYQGKLVYVVYIGQGQTHILVSYEPSGLKAFKVNIAELTDLDFKIEQNNL